MLLLKHGTNEHMRPFAEQKLLTDCKECFEEECRNLSEIGEQFVEYFLEHSTEEGVLFKTIKEMTADLNIPHQSLTKVLKALERKEIIYRRNGIIGLIDHF